MMYIPGRTPSVISGQKSIAPSRAASSSTEMTSAFRRKSRARTRDSASFSSMHCDKLPRSLTDTPPPKHLHIRERHLDAAREKWPDCIRPVRGFRPGRVRWSCGVRAISVGIDTRVGQLCPTPVGRSRLRGEDGKVRLDYGCKLLHTNCLQFYCEGMHHFLLSARLIPIITRL